jgi:hypothetical protein
MDPAWSVSLNAGTSLTTIWGVSKSDIWVGGKNGTLLHWDGHTWTPTSAPNLFHWNGTLWKSTGSPGVVGAIHGSASNDVWAVGNLGTIQHWDGSATDKGVWVVGDDEAILHHP